MAETRKSGHRRVRFSTLASVVLVVVTSGSESRPADDLQRIDWKHPSVELYFAGVSDAGDRARIELCVTASRLAGDGRVQVGFPRYAVGLTRWSDAVIQGVDRNRTLHVSATASPACFAIFVPRHATTLALPIAGETLDLDIRGWLSDVERGEELTEDVDDSWDRDQTGFQPEQGEPTQSPANPPSPPAHPVPPPAMAAQPSVSDVDRTIPRSPLQRPSALAVVLGVEAYLEAPPASHAAADARTAARYFEQALGIPSERIEMLVDHEVTLGQMQRIFGADGWLARRVTSDSEIFVFFSGHGMAELEKFTPYLLPADADPDYLRQTALPLDRLIEMLAALGARRTDVFIDACFSGRSREGTALLTDARPLVVVQSQPTLAGISVYSAASRSQLASALVAQGHGLFSYYLFKGLGGDADLDHDRRIVADELKSYIEDNVPRAAKALDREQLPAIALDDPDQLLVQLP